MLSADGDTARQVADWNRSDDLVVVRVDNDQRIRLDDYRLTAVARCEIDDPGNCCCRRKHCDEDPPGPAGRAPAAPRTACRRKLGVLVQNPPLELLKLRAGLESELFVEGA